MGTVTVKLVSNGTEHLRYKMINGIKLDDLINKVEIDLVEKIPSIKLERHRLRKAIKNIIEIIGISSIITFMNSPSVFANAVVTTKRKSNIMESLQPLIDVLQDFAEPVGIAMCIWGFIEIMIGNERGREKIKWAIIAYIGIYLIPFLFDILGEAFRNLRAS